MEQLVPSLTGSILSQEATLPPPAHPLLLHVHPSLGQRCNKSRLHSKVLCCEYGGRSHFTLLAVTASSAFGADSTFGDCQVPQPGPTHLLPTAPHALRPQFCCRRLPPGQTPHAASGTCFLTPKNLPEDRAAGLDPSLRAPRWDEGATVRTQPCPGTGSGPLATSTGQ